jgi:hypothetical protein
MWQRDAVQCRRPQGRAPMPTRIWACVLLTLGSAAAAPLLAQTQGDEWQFRALLYLYLPQINGQQTFRTGTADITVDPSQILNNLNGAFMGAFEVQKGVWGAYTDLLYVDAGNSKSGTRDLSIGGGISLPATVSAYLNLSVKTTMWTLGGSYRVVASPQATLDLVAGFRTLFLKQRLGYDFSSDFGPFVGPARQGSGETSTSYWDGIVGVKGRWTFGDHHQWYVPYYLDLGTGGSQFTWQGIAGLGYAFDWGELVAVWRYVDYQFDHGARLSLNGPALGVAFRW